jgi:predicted amidohydrolase
VESRVKGESLKVGLVQMSMTADTRANTRKALEGVRKAAAKGAGVVCLPELFTMRYFPASKGAKASPETIPGPTSRALSEAAKANRTVVVGGSIYEESKGRRYNTCLTFGADGRVLSKYRKVHLPEDEHYFEQDYFAPGDSYPLAATPKARFGTLICFDQWYPEPARILRLRGAEVLFYPTAIGWVKGIEPVEGDWKRAWEAVQVGHAVANSVVVCAVNRVGTEGDTSFWGGSFVCDQFGKILLRADDKEGVHVVPVDLGLGRVVEGGWGFLRNRRKDSYARLVE